MPLLSFCCLIFQSVIWVLISFNAPVLMALSETLSFAVSIDNLSKTLDESKLTMLFKLFIVASISFRVPC